ncbi:MAG: hypothetical protein KDD62_00745 [Bdellovibrionales bacterium]|nr:hypothetical protein [Bdellovibrionales bacterium]
MTHAKQSHRTTESISDREFHQVIIPSYEYIEGVSRSVTNGNSFEMRQSASDFLSELGKMHHLLESKLDLIVPNREMGIESVLKLLERASILSSEPIGFSSGCPLHITKHFHCTLIDSKPSYHTNVFSFTDDNACQHHELLAHALSHIGNSILDIKSKLLAKEIGKLTSTIGSLYWRVISENSPLAVVVAQEQFTGEPGVAGLYLLQRLYDIPNIQEHITETYGINQNGYFLKQHGLYGATTIPLLNVGIFLRARGVPVHTDLPSVPRTQLVAPARDLVCQFLSFDTAQLHGRTIDLGVMGQLHTYDPKERVFTTQGNNLLDRSNLELLNSYADTMREIHRLPTKLSHLILAPSGSLANRVQAELALKRTAMQKESQRNRILCSSLAHSSVRSIPEAHSIPVTADGFQMNQNLLFEQLPYAAAVFVTATQTNTGVVEQLGKEALEYIRHHRVPIIIDGCAAAVTASLPDQKPIGADDNSPELVSAYQQILNLETTAAMSTDLGKIAGSVGQLSIVFLSDELNEFADTLCSSVESQSERSVWSYGCQELSATIAQAGLLEVTRASLPGIRYQVLQSKAAALRIADRLRRHNYKVLPVNGHSLVVDVGANAQQFLDSETSKLNMHVAAAAFKLDDKSHFEGIRVVLPLRPFTLYDEISIGDRLMRHIPNRSGKTFFKEGITTGDPKTIFYRTQRDIASASSYFKELPPSDNEVTLTKDELLFEHAKNTLSHQFYNLGLAVSQDLGYCLEAIHQHMNGALLPILATVTAIIDSLKHSQIAPWGGSIDLGSELVAGLADFGDYADVQFDTLKMVTQLSQHLSAALLHLEKTVDALTKNEATLAEQYFRLCLRSIDSVPSSLLNRKFCEERFMQLPALPFENQHCPSINPDSSNSWT